MLKPGKELFCPSCPSQGRKEPVCPCEMGREIGNPGWIKQRHRVTVGPMSCSQGAPRPPRGVCSLLPRPKCWLSIPTVCQRPPHPSPHCHGPGQAATLHSPSGLSHGHRKPLAHAAHPSSGLGHCCQTCLSLCRLPQSWREI